MAITREEIYKLKQYYVEELYKDVRKEQEIDQQYRDDTFPVPEIREPHRIWRSGMGYRVVDAPAEQIITSNPQVFVRIFKGDKDAGERISREINQVWIEALRRQMPNPFKETLKNHLCRGESYIKVCHNETWVVPPMKRVGLPVLFLMLDPMVIYGSPEESELGIPEKVLVIYRRQPLDVIVRYPHWTNPKDRGKNKFEDNRVEWLEYWDSDVRYFEADAEPVLKGGIQPNPYGFVPFVRRYSGFGRRSPDGNLKDLIVSDIRFYRDLIKQECIKQSNIYSIEDLFAHRPRTIVTPGKIDEKQAQNLQFGSYDLNILQNVAPGTDFLKEDYPAVPAEMYASLASIRAEIAQRCPFVMAGFPLGSSGRQQDIAASAAMRRYDTVVENTESAWAQAFEMALKICNPKVIPKLKPESLNKRDLDTTFRITVTLKAKDPVEADRLATLGSRLFQMGEIDIRTNLTKYQGYTEDEADDIIANILVDKLTLYNPDVASVMGMVFAEESGMERWIEEARQKRAEIEQGAGLTKPPSPTEIQRGQGEIETQLGREQAPEGLRGARRPPERWFR